MQLEGEEVLVRVSPAVDPHTHAKTTTGTLDSKFGFSIETGDGARAIRQAGAASGFNPAPRWRCGAAMPRCCAAGLTVACGYAHGETGRAGLCEEPGPVDAPQPRGTQLCASTASSRRAMMLVILIAGFTAGPAVSL